MEKLPELTSIDRITGNQNIGIANQRTHDRAYGDGAPPVAQETLGYARSVMKVRSCIMLLVALSGPLFADPGAAFFEKEIVPLLEKRCFECHSHESGKAKGGLVLDSRSGWGSRRWLWAGDCSRQAEREPPRRSDSP